MVFLASERFVLSDNEVTNLQILARARAVLCRSSEKLCRHRLASDFIGECEALNRSAELLRFVVK